MYDRCITRGIPGSMMPAIYGNSYQIVQGPGYVAIKYEMVNETRIIPLGPAPHLNGKIRRYLGDARGHFEGNTLVVDTTNFSPQSSFRGSSDNLHLIERFTRVDAATINYEIEVSDPTTWTKSWTAMIPLKSSNQQIYEYACHEGNEGLAGALSGTRAQEKAEAEAARKGSN
jgi:hypothetical protein